jgi:hypothetical protein
MSQGMSERIQGAQETAERHARRLGEQGYLHLRGADLAGAVRAADLAAFGANWDSLPPDLELVDGGRYRFRRYGRLRAATGPDGELRLGPLPHAMFRQDARHIPLYAGRERTFAPIPEPLLMHPAMRGIVAFDLGIAQRLAPDIRTWVVGLHMVRIVAEPDAAGSPTPEGRHRDGHRYVGMHLLARVDCAGGRSLVYANGGSAGPDVELTLLEPLDSLLVDDTVLEHEVTPIEGQGRRGLRDMLLVDLNPEVDEA